MTSFTDKELVALMPNLRKVCVKLVGPDNAEDLCQDTLARALQNKDKFKEGTSLIAWLIRMAENLNKDQGRRGWRASYMEHDNLEKTANDRLSHAISNPLKVIEAKQTILAMTFLSAERRSAVVARIDESDYAKLSEQTGIVIGTLKSRVSRGRQDLADIMDNGSVPSLTDAHIKATLRTLQTERPDMHIQPVTVARAPS